MKIRICLIAMIFAAVPLGKAAADEKFEVIADLATKTKIYVGCDSAVRKTTLGETVCRNLSHDLKLIVPAVEGRNGRLTVECISGGTVVVLPNARITECSVKTTIVTNAVGNEERCSGVIVFNIFGEIKRCHTGNIMGGRSFEESGSENPKIPELQRIVISDAGIYKIKNAPYSNIVSSVGRGEIRNTARTILQETTTTIPATIGTSFGFFYAAIGQPESAGKTVKMVTHYPPPGLKTETGAIKTTAEYSFSVMFGEKRWRGYEFSRDAEFLLGTWTFEIFDGDRKLAEQSFTVVKSDPKPASVRFDANTPTIPGTKVNLGRCHMGYCSWTREQARVFFSGNDNGKLYRLIIVGGETPEAVGANADPELINWNPDAKEAYVYCAKRFPVVMYYDENRKFQPVILNLSANGSVPGALEASFNLYAFTCHDVLRATESYSAETFAKKFGYDANLSAFDKFASRLTRPDEILTLSSNVGSDTKPSSRTYAVLNNVSGGVLNMRSGPGKNHSLVVGLPAGATGLKLGVCQDSDDQSHFKWCQAKWQNHSGWISSCCIVDSQDGGKPY